MNFEEWKQHKISREEENRIPEFHSHSEARNYFKDLYGENFQMQDSTEFEEKKIYFYHLILDKEQYWEALKEMNNQEIKRLECTEDESLIDKFIKQTSLLDRYMFSYQSIEISENGNLHISH